MKPVKMWVVCYPLQKGGLYPFADSFAHSKKEAIRLYSKRVGQLWKKEYASGARAVRVEVKPI